MRDLLWWPYYSLSTVAVVFTDADLQLALDLPASVDMSEFGGRLDATTIAWWFGQAIVAYGSGRILIGRSGRTEECNAD